MSFLTLAALAVGLLVAAPIVAHLLRRKPPEEVAFTAVDLVPATTATAQRRNALEDRALFFVRAIAVLALAILGATPFVTCQRLSLARDGGASVAIAIVLDDSMSMQAATPGETVSRFDRAREGARELLAGLREGDAVAVVLAGDPPRVHLAATTNLDAVREAIETTTESDRGTDLDGAVTLAADLLRELSHVDKRVVVLSDLAAGTGQPARALEAPEGMKLWVPLDALQGPADDCAVVGAERQGRRVGVRLACSPAPTEEAAAPRGSADAASGRRLRLSAGDRTLVEVPFRRLDGPQDLTLVIPEDADLDPALRLYVSLTGTDAIAADDLAPVVRVGGRLQVVVVTDAAENAVATGGPPPVEQAFAALRLGVQIRPRSTVPDRATELDGIGLLIVDDVPGFTPAQRRALTTWIEGGGVLLLTLGPGAASAPLGQTFDPMVPGLVRWQREPPPGVDRDQDRLFTDAGSGLEDLAPKGRAALELEEDDETTTLVSWADGRPFALEHRMGRGVVVALTLPFDTAQSDLALRPGFLELLKRMTDTARTLGGVSRSTVGNAWTLQGFDEVRVVRLARDDSAVPLEVELAPGGKTRRVVPERAGLYALTLDGNETTRVAAVREGEVDLRPRPADANQRSDALGGVEASVDVSSYVALALLALILAEMIIRVASRRRAPSPDESDERGDPTANDEPPVDVAAA